MKENSSRKIFEKILANADLKDKVILEIGCGDGRVTTLLAGKPGRLVAIDPDERQIREAKINVKGVDFQIGSGESMAFADICFDLVIFSLSLHHQNSQKAIAEARRVLKDEGSILVIEPVPAGELEQLCALLNNENQEKAEAQNAINNSGLYFERSEIFEARWVFDNEEDLFNAIFGYYGMPFESGIASQMSSLLGEKIKIHPIELVDLMVIQILRKTAKT